MRTPAWVVAGVLAVAVQQADPPAQHKLGLQQTSASGVAASPDVLGIRIGMVEQEAHAAVGAALPQDSAPLRRRARRVAGDGTFDATLSFWGASRPAPDRSPPLRLSFDEASRVVAVERTISFDSEPRPLVEDVRRDLAAKYGPPTSLSWHKTGLLLRWWYDAVGRPVPTSGVAEMERYCDEPMVDILAEYGRASPSTSPGTATSVSDAALARCGPLVEADLIMAAEDPSQVLRIDQILVDWRSRIAEVRPRPRPRL